MRENDRDNDGGTAARDPYAGEYRPGRPTVYELGARDALADRRSAWWDEREQEHRGLSDVLWILTGKHAVHVPWRSSPEESASGWDAALAAFASTRKPKPGGPACRAYITGESYAERLRERVADLRWVLAHPLDASVPSERAL